MAKHRLDPRILEIISPSANPVGSPQPFSTKDSRSHNENGHSYTTGLRGTVQKYDDGSVVTEATESMNAYRKDTGLNGKLTGFWRRVQQGTVLTVQQGNYSYQGRQLAVSILYQRVDGIPTQVPPGVLSLQEAPRTRSAGRCGSRRERPIGSRSGFERDFEINPGVVVDNEDGNSCSKSKGNPVWEI